MGGLGHLVKDLNKMKWEALNRLNNNDVKYVHGIGNQ